MAGICQYCTVPPGNYPSKALCHVFQDIVAANFVNWLDSSEVAAVVAPSSAAGVTLSSIGIHKPLMRRTRCVCTSGST